MALTRAGAAEEAAQNAEALRAGLGEDGGMLYQVACACALRAAADGGEESEEGEANGVTARCASGAAEVRGRRELGRGRTRGARALWAQAATRMKR